MLSDNSATHTDTETPANKDVTSDITGTHTMVNCVVLLD